jgi:hypothetical protein
VLVLSAVLVVVVVVNVIGSTVVFIGPETVEHAQFTVCVVNTNTKITFIMPLSIVFELNLSED